MGYYTSYSLTVSKQNNKKQKPPETIDSIIKRLKKGGDFDPINLAKELEAATKYTPPETEESIIKDLREQYEGAAYSLDEEGETAEDSKWYEHEAELKEFSKNYPDWLFTLHGEGEEAGDIWNKYFINGKVQVSKAVVTVPQFDPDQLQ